MQNKLVSGNFKETEKTPTKHKSIMLLRVFFLDLLNKNTSKTKILEIFSNFVFASALRKSCAHFKFDLVTSVKSIAFRFMRKHHLIYVNEFSFMEVP